VAVAKCNIRECPLFGRREVPYAGNLNAKVVALGESPGAQENRHGTPFYEHAPAGGKFRELAKMAGVPWGDLFLMNSARCMIMKDQMAPKQITKVLACCRKYVSQALKALKPKAVIVAGDIALKQMLGKSGIKKARGGWMFSQEFNCWVMPTYHPAYVCRNPSMGLLVVEDLKMVREFVKNGYRPIDVDNTTLRYVKVPSIRKFLEASQKKEYYVGIDTEGQGLDWSHPDYLTMCYTLSFRPGTGLMVQLFEECSEEESEESFMWPRAVDGAKKKELVEVFIRKAPQFDKKLDELEELLASACIKKYMMHGNHDVHAFRTLFRKQRGRNPVINRYCIDVQAAAHLIDENVYQMADLTMIQRTFTDFVGDYKGDFDRKYDKGDMLNILTTAPDDFLFYAVGDADVTLRAGLAQREWFLQHPRQANYLAKMTMPSLETLMLLEENGALIDIEALPVVTERFKGLMDEAENKALAVVPADVLQTYDDKIKKARASEKSVLTMDTIVRAALFSEEGFGLEVIKRSKTKEPSVDKEVRSTLLDKPLKKKVRTFLEEFNLFSEYHTMFSRYLKGFDKNIRWDSRIHTHYSLCVAVTGRVASRNPNMMNNPKRSRSAKEIRRLIIAPPGYKLLAVDESQSELRWAAHVANEPEMIRIFRAGNLDIHTETAKDLYGGRWDDLDEKGISTQRRNAKAVNFGLLFLMGLIGFIRYAKLEYGIDLTKDQGQAWIDTFFGKYRGLPKYHRKAIDSCRSKGYVESPLGRLRRLPGIMSEDSMLRHEAERQAVNQPIQSPSSDTVLVAANEMRKEGLFDNCDELRPIMFVHDELVFEVREDKVEEYAAPIKHHMEHPPLKRDFDVDLKVPLVAELKVGQNLAEMQGLTL
jgi:uracil-DNA glycosylase family 4